MSNESKKIMFSRIQVLITIVVLIATVATLFGSVKIQVKQNKEDIACLKEDQPEIAESLFEIKINLKHLMEKDGLKYQEGK